MYVCVCVCVCVYVCIQPVRLCLLVGTFNPFTFKVIIDIYVPISIFLIVLGLFLKVCFLTFLSSFFVLVFPT